MSVNVGLGPPLPKPGSMGAGRAMSTLKVTGAAVAADYKIGFVNAERLWRDSAPAKRAQQKLEKEGSVMSASAASDLQKNIEKLSAALRAKSLVERILAFSRSGIGERVPATTDRRQSVEVPVLPKTGGTSGPANTFG